jgi:hypothetical protein
MFDTDLTPPTDGHQIVRHHLNGAQAKWERLTVSDYVRIATVADLIAAVAKRYSLTPALAKQDVEGWLRDVGL